MTRFMSTRDLLILFNRLRLNPFDRRCTMLIRYLAMAFVVLVLFASGSAHAALVDNGNNLIYDTDLNITWYNPALGSMTWDQATAWAAGLTEGGVTGWRLPSALNTDGSAPDTGYDLIENELGHLYYAELGNTSKQSGSSCGGLTNRGFFTNLQPLNYWTNTEWASFAVDNAWAFSFISGLQGHADKNPDSTYVIYYSAMGVHSGNVGATQIPEPGVILLLAPGLAGLAIIRRKFIGLISRS
jgi:hypothetical protein